MDRARPILRGAAEGVAAGVVALAVVAGVVWQFDVGLDPDAGSLRRVFLLFHVVNGVVFGSVLAALLGERRVALAATAAGCSLYAAVAGLDPLSAHYFLFVLIPPLFLASGLGAFAALVLLPADEGRRELAAWTLGGYVASLLLTLFVATVAPESLAALDPVLVDAAEVAELSLDRGSLFAMFAFYPFYGPITFPIAAAGYGAGLRAVGVGTSREGGADARGASEEAG